MVPHVETDAFSLLSPFHQSDWTAESPTTLRHVSGVRFHVRPRRMRIGISTPSEYWALSIDQNFLAFIPRSSPSVLTDLDVGLNPAIQEASRSGQLRWTAQLIRAGAEGGRWIGTCKFKTKVVWFNALSFQDGEDPLQIRYTEALRQDTALILNAIDMENPQFYGHRLIVLDVPQTRHARLDVLARAARLPRVRKTQTPVSDRVARSETAQGPG